MSFKKLIFTTLTTSVLLLIFPAFPKNKLAFGESTSNSKINNLKPSTVNHHIIFSQDITHILIGARIITQFSPRNEGGEKIDINKLALELGYDHFNWVNYVEKDPYGIVDSTGKKLSTPYNDPPAGGYQYDRADRFPFYWDVVDCDRCNQRHHFQNHNNLQQFQLVFEDSPADYRLKPGEAVEFITSLVGVKTINPKQNTTEWEILHTFRWQLNNPRLNYSQVSLIDKNVDFNQVPPLLKETMVSDGAALLTPIEVSDSN